MMAQGCYEQIAILCRRAGIPGTEAELVTGYGGLEETLLLSDLWQVARGSTPMDGFVARHGYHGPSSGTCRGRRGARTDGRSSPCSRPTRTFPTLNSPSCSSSARSSPGWRWRNSCWPLCRGGRRPIARAVLKAASRFVPLGEIGKTAYIQAIDVARLAARIAGRELAAAGTVDEPGDVFFLTRAELVTAAGRDPCRRRRAPGVLRGVQAGPVADYWDGAPEPLQAGEILVCETTNPSWVTLFLVADAMVIDIGGVISHGAIAARELGIPCVINTRNGTRVLHTGDVVRVDGSTGTVEVLERASVREVTA